MVTLSYAQLEGLWLKSSQGTKYHTHAWAALMAAIAEAESGGNPNAQNDQDNGGTQSSFGLWQISTGTHTPPSPRWADPSENARLAIGKLNGQGLTAWGTYDSGAYKAYLNGKTTPDPNVPGNPQGQQYQLTAADARDCAFSIGIHAALIFPVGPTFGGCVISKSQLRGVMGGLFLLLGGGVTVVGLAILGLSAARPALGVIENIGNLPGVARTEQSIGRKPEPRQSPKGQRPAERPSE